MNKEEQNQYIIRLYFENFSEEDKQGNGVGQASYAEEIGILTAEPDEEMWEALKQWAKRLHFTDVTSSDIWEGVTMDNWIKVNSASSETKDAIDSIAEVLKDMDIDLVYDDEQATEDNVDLFIRLNHIRKDRK